jgi:phosphonate transport system substrate-binding protein
MKQAVGAGAIVFALAATVAAGVFVRVRDLSSEGAPLAYAGSPAPDPRPEKVVGVVSRLAPATLYEGYQPVLDYLSRATPYRFRLRASRGYRDAVDDLVAGRTQAAFVGSLLYVEAHAAHGVVPVVRPRNARGEPLSESLVVVREDSPIHVLGDLAGRTVAVPPSDSLSANWLRLAVAPGLDFRTVSYGHHEAVVRNVLRGIADAGVVKERVAAEHVGHGLRVLARSGPMPSSPLIVAKDADPAFVDAVRRALLALKPADDANRAARAAWDPEFAWGFAPAADRDYDAIRALRIPLTDLP